MLPKEYRLKNKAAFSATYRIKNSFYKDGIVLYAGKLKADNENPTRVGFVVSKKTHKRAVRRNRLKRLMRESYRLILKSNDVGNSQKYMSLIFVGYEKALGQAFDEVQKNINTLIKELN
jgi:ribonuclease P protein component